MLGDVPALVGLRDHVIAEVVGPGGLGSVGVVGLDEPVEVVVLVLVVLPRASVSASLLPLPSYCELVTRPSGASFVWTVAVIRYPRL